MSPLRVISAAILGGLLVTSASAQPDDAPVAAIPSSPAAQGDVVPREVREITERGLQFLVQSQQQEGNWPDGESGPGTTGLCLLAFLASGEDPNFGIYSSPIRKSLRHIIKTQHSNTGYLGSSMYHHGFGMLALAEAYGAVDETDLWSNENSHSSQRRSIGEALELAVRGAVTSQAKNPFNAWRYSPSSRDADTSVSGAVLVGLLAARNAGIEVPDQSIDKAVQYFVSMTSDSGSVAYSGGMGGMGDTSARSAITCLVLAIAKRKDLKQYESVKKHIARELRSSGPYLEYTRYYQAQALFQSDLESWEKWNRGLIRELKSTQNADGSFDGQFGRAVSTSMGLLALALNYKFLPIYER